MTKKKPVDRKQDAKAQKSKRAEPEAKLSATAVRPRAKLEKVHAPELEELPTEDIWELYRKSKKAKNGSPSATGQADTAKLLTDLYRQMLVIRRVEEATGFACLPENPPSHFYLGDLHILDYFALVSERAACGLLLDCAHLAIFQRLRGLLPLTALDGYPLDRVVEVHVAGGTVVDVEGLALVEDDHSPTPLPETFEILDHVIARAPNLKAIVFECEKNPVASVLPVFEALNARFPRTVATAQ